MSAPTLRASLFGSLAMILNLAPASAQSWQQTLTGQTTTEYDRFGTSLERAGGELFVGSSRDDATGAIRGSGSVTIFTDGSAGWSEEDLLLSPNMVLDGNFGTALSLDGARLLVGAPGESSLAAPATGIVHVFERAAGVWSPTGTLEVGNLAAGDRFGYDVAIEGDRAAVGAPGREHGGWNTGCVILFQNTPTGWVEDARLFPPVDSVGARFGHSLALFGETLVVGAPEDNRPELASGAAYVFTHDEQAGWSMQAELTAEGVGEFQRFGAAVSIGASSIVVGGPGSYEPFGDSMGPQSSTSTGPPRGIVWIYHSSLEGWSPVQRLRAPAGDNGDLFGQRVYMAEGLLSVSSGGRPTAADREGASFLYEESGSGWFLTQEISDPSPSAGQLFGAVAVHAGGEIFVSGVFDAGLGTNSGCVQVFGIDSERHQSCFGDLCPCGNNDSLAGCANSTGSGSELFALGSASLSEDDLIVGVRGLPAGTPTLVFFSDTSNQAFFGDGILCAGGGSLARTGRLGRPKRASGEGEASWGPGLISSPGLATTPERLHLQAIYRDTSGPCGSGLNLSNALEFELIP